MRFALSAEHRAFGDSIHDLLTDAQTPAIIRGWADGKHDPGLALWHKLSELGVTALAVPESHGGFGADAVDLAVAFEALGYHAVPGPLVESVAVLPTLLARCADPSLADRWLPDLASGASLGTIVLEPRVPYALDADVADVLIHVTDDKLREGTPSPTGPIASIDRARRLFPVETTSSRPPAQVGEEAATAFAYGVFASAAQLLGAGQWLLDTSVSYAQQRAQYGRPIGQYQAIKHLLADVVTHLELARPLVYGAAVALAQDSSSADRDVSAARVAVTAAADLAARTALQVHGAIGYTAEHDLGLWLTKVRALRSAWGTQRFHRGRVLGALLTDRKAR